MRGRAMKSGEDPPLVSDVLSDLKDRGLAHVVEEAAARHHVSVFDVLGPRRQPTTIDARREAACRLYVEFGRAPRRSATSSAGSTTPPC